jgi:hypothetical protein
MAESIQEKAARYGYSISKSGGGYALINENSEYFCYCDSLEEIEEILDAEEVLIAFSPGVLHGRT